MITLAKVKERKYWADKLEIKSAAHLAEEHETIYAVTMMDSFFDKQFCTEVFDLVANGRPVRRLEVEGHEIGSNVMVGAAKYFIQFC